MAETQVDLTGKDTFAYRTTIAAGNNVVLRLRQSQLTKSIRAFVTGSATATVSVSSSAIAAIAGGSANWTQLHSANSAYSGDLTGVITGLNVAAATDVVTLEVLQ